MLCDVWGVVHDGVRAHPEATAALSAIAPAAARWLLVTNAPRPKAAVVAVLDGFGVPREAYDDVLTSGDAARRRAGSSFPVRKILHVGPDRDLAIYDGLPVTVWPTRRPAL